MNIGPRQRRLRVIFGAIAIGVGIALLAVLVTGDLTRWARLGLLVPAYLAAVSLLQARERT